MNRCFTCNHPLIDGQCPEGCLEAKPMEWEAFDVQTVHILEGHGNHKRYALCDVCRNSRFQMRFVDDHVTKAVCTRCGAEHVYSASGQWQTEEMEA